MTLDLKAHEKQIAGGILIIAGLVWMFAIPNSSTGQTYFNSGGTPFVSGPEGDPSVYVESFVAPLVLIVVGAIVALHK